MKSFQENQKAPKSRALIWTVNTWGMFLIGLLFLACTAEESFTGAEDLNASNAKVNLEPWEAELVRLTKKVRPFQNFTVAQARGYTEDITGYVPNMGHHFSNPEFLDGTFELEKPEALLYVPDEDGVMQLVGVEYLVLMEDPANPPPPPDGFTGSEDVWTIVGPFWTLHAWVVLDNPDGVFNATNSNVP